MSVAANDKCTALLLRIVQFVVFATYARKCTETSIVVYYRLSIWVTIFKEAFLLTVISPLPLLRMVPVSPLLLRNGVLPPSPTSLASQRIALDS